MQDTVGATYNALCYMLLYADQATQAVHAQSGKMHSLPGGHMHAVMHWTCKAYHVPSSIMVHQAVSKVPDHGKLHPDAVCTNTLITCPLCWNPAL